MSYSFSDLYEVLEKILPLEFGGGPGDYQIVEEEDSGVKPGLASSFILESKISMKLSCMLGSRTLSRPDPVAIIL